MKTVKAFGKHEMMVMTQAEFKDWMKDKTCYHPVVHWVEEWKGSMPIENYIPMKSFILPKTMKLKEHYHYRNPKVLDSYIAGTETEDFPSGKGYWQVDHWTASLNERTKRVNVVVVKGA